MANKDSVGICNLALTMLSTSRIASLTEDSENARKCNAIYDLTRDALLTDSYWNFALKEASLALVDDTPTIEDWAYIFQVPTDCLLIIHNDGNYPYMIVGNKLYSNESTAKVRYIKRVEDASTFSNSFIRAFAARLAADLAYGITQNATLAEGMEKKALIAIKEAKWTDSQEGIGNVPIGSSFITERGL